MLTLENIANLNRVEFFGYDAIQRYVERYAYNIAKDFSEGIHYDIHAHYNGTGYLVSTECEMEGYCLVATERVDELLEEPEIMEWLEKLEEEAGEA